MWFNVLLQAWCCHICNRPIGQSWPKPCDCEHNKLIKATVTHKVPLKRSEVNSDTRDMIIGNTIIINGSVFDPTRYKAYGLNTLVRAVTLVEGYSAALHEVLRFEVDTRLRILR